MNIPQQYAQASIKTADNLRTIAHSVSVQDVSTLSLPEIDAVVDIISPCVTFNDHEGSTKSYTFTRERVQELEQED